MALTPPALIYLVFFLLLSAVSVITLWVWLHCHGGEKILHRIVAKVKAHTAKI